jgi:BMFP domain-containing protein YqiC
MINAKVLDDLSRKIRELAASGPAADANRNVRALLQGAFTKLELVNREEFDVQSEVLRRTREKLAALEAKVEELEGLLQQKENQQL